MDITIQIIIAIGILAVIVLLLILEIIKTKGEIDVMRVEINSLKKEFYKYLKELREKKYKDEIF